MVSGRKRVAIASFEFEGNDFSPKINDLALFNLYAVGGDVFARIEGRPLAVTGAVEVLREEGGLDLVPILVAHGGSGGKVEDDFYRRTTDAIVAGIREQGPFDGVYLALHGAMVSGGVKDAEGELLSAVREIVGSGVPIAASLDLHAHVSARMVRTADILVGYANYPHDDAYDTGKRAAALLRDTLAGKLRPVMRMTRLPMLVPVTGSCTRYDEAPLARVKKLARSLETDGVVSTSYFTVQPWLDDDEAGNVALAITDGDAGRAEGVSRQIAQHMWDLREEFELPLLSVESAIEQARGATVRPFIFADTADCVGAGASGDAAYVLAALLKHAGSLRCAVSLVDAQVAAEAHAAGAGAVLDATLGFRADPRYGEPVPVKATVVNLHDGSFTYVGGPSGGVVGDMGPTAVLQAGGVRVLVASKPTYEYADEQFRAAGIDPDDCDVLVLKNGMNFRNLLGPRTPWVLLDSVGASPAGLGALPWRNRPSPFWPRDRNFADPF
ncbi:MAG TPA: M81 family metallopeptidase [Bordetella sp.]